MPSFCLEVSGPFACFTRPEMKVERVSYDVMTPSSARSIFEAILWKPAIRWRVHRIEVLKPIRWINLRRNEVSAVVSTRNVGWMLHDMDFTHPSDPQPRFFNAKMVAGVVEVPPFEEARG